MFIITRGLFTRNAVEKYKLFLVPLVGFFIGYELDKAAEERARSFHNKSMLFGGRDLAPGERIW